jgi:hypothetical protein
MKTTLSQKILLGLAIFVMSMLASKVALPQGVVITPETGSEVTPHASAILEMRATDKGMLIPRLTTAQRTALPTPANGLMVFDTTEGRFFYYDSAKSGWVRIMEGAGTTPGLTYNPNAGPDDAIFVVHNSDGKIVFAVYHTGVRMYVEDTGKGTRGGFAVGGLSDQNKANGIEYLRVTSDSV